MTRARAEFARINAKNRELLEPLIGAHLTSYDAARAELLDAHRYIADQTDLDLQGTSREAGLWLIAGRCIGLAHAAQIGISAWLTVEIVPVLRSLHEATRLLSVFRMPGETALVERWLEGRNVSRGDVMAASRRQEARAREEMARRRSDEVAGVRRHQLGADVDEGRSERRSSRPFEHSLVTACGRRPLLRRSDVGRQKSGA